MAEEIRFGTSTDNLANITFGDRQIEEVRFGTDGLLVWRNNATPEFSNVVFAGVALNENDDLTVIRRTARNITFTLTDDDGASHFPIDVKLFDGTDEVDDIDYTFTDTTGTLTIPATHFADAAEVGTVNRGMTIEATDAEDGVTEYPFNVEVLDFTAPSISGTNSATGSAASRSFSYSISPSTSGTGLTTTPSGSVTVSAACGSSGSQTVTASTTGGGLTRSASRTFTYSRTATTNGALNCPAYGACSANAPENCGFTDQTCTATGTQTRTCTQAQIRICDNANLGIVNIPQSQSCSDSNANQSYVAPISVSCTNGVANVTDGTCTVSLGSNGADITVSSYAWTATGSATLTNANTATVTLSSTAATSGTATVVVTFSDGSSTTTRTDNDSYSLPANNFACSNAGYSVANGTAGDSVSASVSAGTLVSTSPATYTLGNNITYTGTITAPSGYTNSGSNITCTDTANGAQALPSIQSCAYTVSTNPISVSTGPKTFRLSGINTSVTLSSAENVFSSVSSTFNVTCTSQGGGVTILTTPSSGNAYTFFNSKTTSLSTMNSNNGTYNATNNTNVNVNSNIRCTGSVTFTGTQGISGGSCTVSGLTWDE